MASVVPLTAEEVNGLFEEDGEESSLSGQKQSGWTRPLYRVMWWSIAAVLAMIGFATPPSLSTFLSGQSARLAGWTTGRMFEVNQEDDSRILRPGTLYRVVSVGNGDVSFEYVFKKEDYEEKRTSFVSLHSLKKRVRDGSLSFIDPGSPKILGYASQIAMLDGQTALAGR